MSILFCVNTQQDVIFFIHIEYMNKKHELFQLEYNDINCGRNYAIGYAYNLTFLEVK